jgi:tRNA 5-methylaminomethyl-2-thiouridine biosynthesis bifunctional protein
MAEPFASLDWTETGAPRSPAFGDIYFSSQDGLAESRAVFLAGCGLPQAWEGRKDFTVGELGFGTGLNIAALLTLWRETAAPGARLHIFSVEGFPIGADDARRALAAWPELARASEALLAAWPTPARGFQRLDLPTFRATLDLAILDVEAALTAWSGKADAWFLDGFSPALNPAMWSESAMAKTAARSNPGARAATFTVAGSVRRGLEAAGFSVDKRPGHGRKRERLEAHLAGAASDRPRPSRIAVIGGGVAGAAVARALAAQDIEPILVADDSLAASANPAALVAPGLDASGRGPARLYAQAFARAVDLYRREPVVIAQGVVRRPRSERDRQRFSKIADQELFPPGGMCLGDNDWLFIRDGLVVEPAALLERWLPRKRVFGHVEGLQRTLGGWRLGLAGGGSVEVEAVVVCAGWGARALLDLPLQPIRGQASFVVGPARPEALVDGDYLIATPQGFLFGATHDRDRTDTDLDAADHRRNLTALHRLDPGLAEGLDLKALQGRAAIRAATADRLPLAGRLDEGLYVLGGLGSRGFTTAPLLAEHVAAAMLSLPSPLPTDLANLVDPLRSGPKPGSRSALVARAPPR